MLPIVAAIAAMIVIFAAETATADDRVDTAAPTHESAVAPAVTEHADTATKDRAAFDLSWWSVDGGGAESAGGAFSLTAAIGQPESGTSNAGGRTLDAGLWSTAVDQQILFADGFEDGTTGGWDDVFGQQ